MFTEKGNQENVKSTFLRLVLRVHNLSQVSERQGVEKFSCHWCRGERFHGFTKDKI